MRRAALALAAAALLGLGGCGTVRIPPQPGGQGRDVRALPLKALAVRDSGDAMAVVLTGDGVFRGLGDGVAEALARAGTPTVVWNSFRYYWTPRTPPEAAADLDRIIRYYGARWHRRRVVLVGYSMGADVLPFLVNGLPADTRGRVRGMAGLAMSGDATFEFRLEQWWGPTQAPTLPILPELRKLSVPDRLCVYGEGDDLTVCPWMGAVGMRVVRLGGGHHFTGSHRQVKQVVVALAQKVERG